MAKQKRVAVLIQPVPPSLKRAIEADAEERGTSASEAAIAVLAAEFGIEYEVRPKTNRTPRPNVPNPTILYVKMPLRLQEKLQRAAIPRHVRYTELARSLLMAHYDLVPEAA